MTACLTLWYLEELPLGVHRMATQRTMKRRERISAGLLSHGSEGLLRPPHLGGQSHLAHARAHKRIHAQRDQPDRLRLTVDMRWQVRLSRDDVRGQRGRGSTKHEQCETYADFGLGKGTRTGCWGLLSSVLRGMWCVVFMGAGCAGAALAA